MKKIFTLIAAMALIMSLSACSAPSSESDVASAGEFGYVFTENSYEKTESISASEQTSEPKSNDKEKSGKMKITVGNTVFTATLADNSSADALKELLSDSPLTIDMRDFGNFEKVGSIGADLPRNDEQITTSAGDIILYQGNSLVIYYDENSWNFTRIGRIDKVTQAELKEALGDGNVTVTFSLG